MDEPGAAIDVRTLCTDEGWFVEAGVSGCWKERIGPIPTHAAATAVAESKFQEMKAMAERIRGDALARVRQRATSSLGD